MSLKFYYTSDQENVHVLLNSDENVYQQNTVIKKIKNKDTVSSLGSWSNSMKFYDVREIISADGWKEMFCICKSVIRAIHMINTLIWHKPNKNRNCRWFG